MWWVHSRYSMSAKGKARSPAAVVTGMTGPYSGSVEEGQRSAHPVLAQLGRRL